MRNYGDGGIGWGGWIAMVSMMIVFWGAIAWVVVTLLRQSSSRPQPPPTSTDPLRILDERFARGDIDEAEYKRRSELLRGGT
jgi:putative membrane protein